MGISGGFWKKAITIAIGGFSGGIAGWFVAELVIYQLDKKSTVNTWVPRTFPPPEEEAPPIFTNTSPVELAEATKKTRKKKINYGQFADEGKGELADMVHALNALPVAEESTVQVDEVRIISEHDYEVRRKDYAKEHIYFYEEDCVFSRDDESRIDDPHVLFGPNIHLQFGSQSSDPDAVYVRNDRLETDFEILRVYQSYASVVLGIEDDTEPDPDIEDIEDLTDDEIYEELAAEDAAAEEEDD